jgi:hypothetical protein|tara:strand:+ start:2070 stop:2498 length:429 start_codon:yes stop_codon:yes gene_type:complete
MSIRRTRKNQPEYELQRAVVSYIKVKYPNILINGSAGGVRTSMSQAIKLKATGSSKGFPDLFIYQPRKVDGQAYCGCALELKVKGNYATKEQKEWIAKLQKNGYYAEVVTDYAEVINRINWYLGDEKKVEKKRKNSKHTKKK